LIALVVQLALANPASVYCVQQGGRLEIVRTNKGEIGICILPDGRRIEEWKFFRANKSGEQPAAR
jgi:uncharacterized protein